MTTELVWSTVKPTFEEVKGKKLCSLYMDSVAEVDITEWVIKTKFDYDLMFDDKFICYADLTAPVSPLPLWGKLPEIFEAPRDGRGSDEWTVKYASFEHKINLVLHSYFTEAKAILAWNRIAEALNEVER